MKKFWICLSLLFSFLFIGNVNAATSHSVIAYSDYNIDNLNFTYNGITYNKTTIYNKITDYLTNNTNYTLNNFKYIFIGIPNKKTTDSNDSNGLIYIDLFGSDFNPTEFYSSGPAYSYWYSNSSSNLSFHFVISFNSGNLSFYDNIGDRLYSMFSGTYSSRINVYTNYLIELSMLKNTSSYSDYMRFYIGNMGYNFSSTNSQKFNVNFHLDGGTVMDMSNVINPNYIEEDYSIETTTEELVDYMTKITPMKPNYSFMGWYYDSEFTQPFDSSNELTSNIDLYAKWRNNIYNINNIDYVEFKFDNIPLRETNISYNFNFKSVTSSGQDETIEFAQPYGREYYTGCDDNNQNCTSNTKFKDKLFFDLGHISYSYTYSDSITFNSNSEHITNSYSVIVPFESSLGNYVYLLLDSNYDYDIIIHYKNDEYSTNSYIRSVDLTGKYGAVFLPKYENDSYTDSGSYFLTNFHVIGNVDIQMTDSRDPVDYNISQIYSMNYCNSSYSEQSDIPYSCDNLSGIFTFKIDNLTANQTLRFVNHAYTELSDKRTIIEYDSRFFNYGILDTPYSQVEVIDPTTNVTETITLSEFYNYFTDNHIGGSKITFSNAFNRFISPIKFIFRQVTKLYNNYLNNSLQHYFFLIFSLAIVILLLRVIF